MNKGCRVQAMKLFEGEEELLHSFLISRLYGCQFHAPLALLQGKGLLVRMLRNAGTAPQLQHSAWSLCYRSYRGSNTFIFGIKFI